MAVSHTRHAGLDGVLRPGSFGYPVVANVNGAYTLTDKWDIATRVSYLQGRPYTPTGLAASTPGTRQIYDLSRVNDARSPDCFRADVHVDHRFTINDRPPSLFIGAQNVTNRMNVSGYFWKRRNNVPRVLDQLGCFRFSGGIGSSSHHLPVGQAQRMPCFTSGNERTRVPVAAKMALHEAGTTGGIAGSPNPDGATSVWMKCTSTGGASRMRKIG